MLTLTEYYPFGLQAATSWTRDGSTNNFLANGATELNTTSQLYDLDYRNYDPILGRMHQVDPMTDMYSSLTPYSYSFNSPAVYNDPNGADPYNPQNYVDPAPDADKGTGPNHGYVLNTHDYTDDINREFGVSLENENLMQSAMGAGAAGASGYYAAGGGSTAPAGSWKKITTYYSQETQYGTLDSDGNFVYDYSSTRYFSGDTYVFTDTPNGYHTGAPQAQGDPQTWYYMSRDIGAAHGMVYDPVGKVIYEVNQVPRQSKWKQIEGLIINSVPSNNIKVNISVAYQYRQGNDAEWSSLWERERKMGSVFLLSPVTVSNPAAATAWFQEQTGNAWPYNLIANNCAHYSVQGLNAGGADINFLGPLPSSFPIAPTMTWTAGQPYPVSIGN